MEQGKKKLRTVWDRCKYPLLIAALGAALLLLPGGGKGKTGGDGLSSQEPAAADVSGTEARMEAILAQIEGVGQLKLMLTAQTGEERTLAQDMELRYSGDKNAPDSYERRLETVLAESDAPVVTQTVYPTWRGALVVCQGAEDAKVKLAVTEAVSALTGLGADRIAVVKCQ